MEYEFHQQIKAMEYQYKRNELAFEKYKTDLLYKYRARFLDKLLAFLEEREMQTKGELKRVEDAREEVERLQRNLLLTPAE